MYALHPFSTHFPLALLLASGLFTLIALCQHSPGWELSAYHCLSVGWLAGVIALLTGMLDALRQLVGPAAPRDNALISWVNLHAFANLVALALYGWALLQRRRQPDLWQDSAARRVYLRLHMVGAALLIGGGWVGGHLVYVLGLGVQR